VRGGGLESSLLDLVREGAQVLGVGAELPHESIVGSTLGKYQAGEETGRVQDRGEHGDEARVQVGHDRPP
jgi:hypothetical protein